MAKPLLMTACPAESLRTRHHKDQFPHKTSRKFNTQVGELFHGGMALRDPKDDWRNPQSTSHPHRSHAVFNEKKVTHKAVHHTSPSHKVGYEPVNTHARTLEVGRPAMGGRLGDSARPHTADATMRRPTSSPAGSQRYTSQQEIALNKRRHMTDIDGNTRGVGSRADERQRTGGRARATPTPAGIPSKGCEDLRKLEPTREHIPHTSLKDFNLKKEQHICPVHRTPRNDRFGYPQ